VGLRILVLLCLALVGFAGGGAFAQAPQQFSGKAAYYDKDYRGKVTAGGDYDPAKFTCAHLTLPFGTRLRVTNVKTKRSVVVTVNDRGPHNKRLVIDLSWAAARELGRIDRGIIDVTAMALPDAPDAKK
jgi:rare lipoprotein A